MKQKFAKQTAKNGKAKKLDSNAVIPTAADSSAAVVQQKVPEIKTDQESEKEIIVAKKPEEVKSDGIDKDEEKHAENKDVKNDFTPKSCRITVKNIKVGSTEDEIKTFFQCCGEVKSVQIIDNGNAFVNFTDRAAVVKALELHNTKFNYANISVHANKPIKKNKKRNEKLTIKLNNKQDFKEMDSTKLQDIFSKCGDIEDLSVLCQKNTLAFITFKTEQAVKKAFELNGTTVQDIELDIAAYNTQKPKTTIYVRNIHPAATKEDLKTLFSQSGEISDIVFNKGNAVIAFKNSDGYCKSFMLDEVLIKKLPIFIEPYSTRKQQFVKNSTPYMVQSQIGDSVFSSKSSKKRLAEATTNVKSVPTPKKAKTK